MSNSIQIFVRTIPSGVFGAGGPLQYQTISGQYAGASAGAGGVFHSLTFRADYRLESTFVPVRQEMSSQIVSNILITVTPA